jgi:hypothetical protein
MKTIRYSAALFAVFATLLGACANIEPVETAFDEHTGLTWSSLRTPVTMARRAPEISTAARNYMYLGPVEMNERGTRLAYLWLGMATTIDGPYRTQDTSVVPQRLLLEVDDLAFELPVTAWSGSAPYETPAPVTQSLQARISLDQIVHVAHAEQVRATLVMANGTTVAYEYWGGPWESWLEFRDAVDPLAGTRTTLAAAKADRQAQPLEYSPN